MPQRRSIVLALAACALANPAAAQTPYSAPLKEEAQGSVAKLPAPYPASWLLVQDLAASHALEGRAIVVDAAAEHNQLKAQIQVAQWGNIAKSLDGREFYVAETFYTRLARGDRTDTLTIYDSTTLEPKAEIVLPDGKRGLFATQKPALQLTNKGRWALVYNFTPAASVTVVDLTARKVLGDIDTPGCSLIYPTGVRGFSTLCSDGTILTIGLDEAGKAARSTSSSPVNRIDTDPMFMMPAMVGQTAWFATFKGALQGIDLGGDTARDLGRFALPRQSGGKPEWRPSGWQIVTADAGGLLYVLMNANGTEGSHKSGGTEVWIVDPASRALRRRIALARRSVTIEVTRQPSPLLVAAIDGGDLDVYDVASGAKLRTISGLTSDPLTITALP